MNVGHYRKLVNRYLVSSCRIEKQISGGVRYGQVAHDWTTVASGVRCRLIRAGNQSMSGAVLVGEREALREEYRLMLPFGAECAANYRVTIDDEVYRVTRVKDALSDSVAVEMIVVREDGAV